MTKSYFAVRIKNLSAILTMVLLLTILTTSSYQAISPSADFIVLSDTHIGSTAIGADGLNATQRLLLALSYINTKNSVVRIFNLGDLVINSKNYAAYLNLIAGRHPFTHVKGNHDFDTTVYTQQVGPLNWATFSNGIYYVGVSCLSENMNQWLTQGFHYNRTTIDFLQSAVTSQEYNMSRYRFLFMHFAPDSTWPLNATFGVSAKFSSYINYFTAVFHGHEGGVARVTYWDGVPVFHTAHLADGRSQTDTFLWVHIYGTSTMNIVLHNFQTKTSSLFYKTDSLSQ